MLIESTFKALADPTRLRIMRLLLTMELAVGELADILAQSQPRISRHVAILCDAGLAARRREGSWVFLRHLLHDDAENTVSELIAQILIEAEKSDPDFARTCRADQEQLERVRAGREERAAAYFAQIAEQWDDIRAMLAPAQQVENALLASLGAEEGVPAPIEASDPHTAEKSAPLGKVLDIGTGTGRIAELVSRAASHVTALDKSPEMLRLSRARLQALPADAISIIQGDFTALPFTDDSFDTVILHQVLHYAQAPEHALAEAARVCRNGGRIAIVDLAAHNHEELRRSHAHVRLGFEDHQIETLLRKSGFAPSETKTLSGAELSVKIWTARRRKSVGTTQPSALPNTNDPSSGALSPANPAQPKAQIL